MILKRQDKDGKIDAIYSSSNILASSYDKTTNNLIITFNKGNQYKYPNVSTSDYTRFELAESQGVVFSSHIKKYAFEKMDSVDPAIIVSTIENLKKEEDNIVLTSAQKKLVGTMITLTAESVNDKGELVFLTEKQLEKLTEDIKNYSSKLIK